MRLSERDCAIIANTITGYISNIPVSSLDDFSHLIHALQAVLNPALRVAIRAEMQSQMELIFNYIDPEFGAVLPEQYDEMLMFVQGIVRERIQYFGHLSFSERMSYIAEQAQRREEARVSQAAMRRQVPPVPGSAAHVLSELDWLEEMQQGEYGSVLRRTFRFWQTHPRISRWRSELNLVAPLWSSSAGREDRPSHLRSFCNINARHVFSIVVITSLDGDRVRVSVAPGVQRAGSSAREGGVEHTRHLIDALVAHNILPGSEGVVSFPDMQSTNSGDILVVEGGSASLRPIISRLLDAVEAAEGSEMGQDIRAEILDLFPARLHAVRSTMNL